MCGLLPAIDPQSAKAGSQEPGRGTDFDDHSGTVIGPLPGTIGKSAAIATAPIPTSSCTHRKNRIDHQAHQRTTVFTKSIEDNTIVAKSARAPGTSNFDCTWFTAQTCCREEVQTSSCCHRPIVTRCRIRCSHQTIDFLRTSASADKPPESGSHSFHYPWG